MRLRGFKQAGALTLTLAMGLIAGCQAAGYVAHAVAGGDPPPVNVTAEYTGLDNRMVAVIVAADPSLMYQHASAQHEIGTAVSYAIADCVPGVKVVDPADMTAFRNANPYWTTAPYGELIEKLGVERLVVVDLHEFRLNEPGNSVMFRGVINGTVEVVEAESADPDTPVYSQLVTAAFPPNRPHGVPEANPATIRKGAVDLFAMATAWKFCDHKEQRQ